MRDMMQTCWDWMMGLGAVGMLLCVGAVVLLIVLLIAMIRRIWSH